MRESLDEGLNALFGAGAARLERTTARDSAAATGAEPSVAGRPLPAPGTAPSAASDQLLREAQTHYDRAIAAQRAGNWTEYGREIEQLGATIRALRAGKQ